MIEDHYTVLGVHRSASEEQIRKAYRDLAHKYHPNVNPGDPEAAKRFVEVQAAFEVLNDPEKRAAYNRTSISFNTLREPPSARPAARRWPNYGTLFRRRGWGSGRSDRAYELEWAGCVDPIRRFNRSFLVSCCCEYVSGQDADLGKGGAVGPSGAGVLQVVGAVCMQERRCYVLALLGSIAAIVSFSPCCCLSPAIGIWSLSILLAPGVRESFRS